MALTVHYDALLKREELFVQDVCSSLDVLLFESHLNVSLL
jgi:hypothetical protein